MRFQHKMSLKGPGAARLGIDHQHGTRKADEFDVREGTAQLAQMAEDIASTISSLLEADRERPWLKDRTMADSGDCMNVRRGMFRLWIVFSALFILGITAASYNTIRQEFSASGIDYDALARKYGGETLLPVDCVQARGVATTDYSLNEGSCWYTTAIFRRLYPEYKEVTDRDLSEKIYAKAGRPLIHPRPWAKVTETAGLAFGVPLLVLAFGCSLSWAFSGFRGPPFSNGKHSATP